MLYFYARAFGSRPESDGSFEVRSEKIVEGNTGERRVADPSLRELSACSQPSS